MQENTIDFSKIKQRKVRDLLQKNGLYTLEALSKLRSICFNPNDGNTYHQHIKKYWIDADVNRVWNTYKTITPQETWNGKMVSFGMMYSRNSNTISFPDDPYNQLEKGQVVFVNLNLLWNVVNLAVGHEITRVDDQEKVIHICYLQNGASIGTQQITLRSISEKETEVIHETWYTSGSWFRDKLLYPGFHTKGISEFHHNVKKKAEANN